MTPEKQNATNPQNGSDFAKFVKNTLLFKGFRWASPEMKLRWIFTLYPFAIFMLFLWVIGWTAVSTKKGVTKLTKFIKKNKS